MKLGEKSEFNSVGEKISPRRKYAATIVGLLALTACLPKPSQWSGDGEGPRVLFIGDSVLNAAENGPGAQSVNTILSDMLKAQPNQYRTAKYTQIGLRTTYLRDLYSAEPEEGRTAAGDFEPGADIGVSNLAANDARVDTETGLSTIPIEESIEYMENYIDILAADCFAVIGLPEPTQEQIPTAWGHENFAPQWNDYWQQRDKESIQIVYGSWAEIVAEHPEYMQSDLIHPTEEGRVAFRLLVIDVVNQCATDNNLDLQSAA